MCYCHDGDGLTNNALCRFSGFRSRGRLQGSHQHTGQDRRRSAGQHGKGVRGDKRQEQRQQRRRRTNERVAFAACRMPSFFSSFLPCTPQRSKITAVISLKGRPFPHGRTYFTFKFQFSLVRYGCPCRDAQSRWKSAPLPPAPTPHASLAPASASFRPRTAPETQTRGAPVFSTHRLQPSSSYGAAEDGKGTFSLAVLAPSCAAAANADLETPEEAAMIPTTAPASPAVREPSQYRADACSSRAFCQLCLCYPQGPLYGWFHATHSRRYLLYPFLSSLLFLVSHVCDEIHIFIFSHHNPASALIVLS